MEDIIRKYNLLFFRDNKKIQSSLTVLQVYYIINNINRY